MIEVIRGCPRSYLLLLHEADRLGRLAQDLEAIAKGMAPRPEVLEAAPILDNWQFGQRSMITSVGALIGHPRLPDGLCQTSEIWAIDQERRWMRTLSRFYVLGAERKGDGHAR
jgi:hypothetical protein